MATGMIHPSGKKNPATENNTGDATGQSTSRICGQGGPGTQKERRRVSSRIIEFGLTQRLIQRHGGGQDPIPGRQGAAEGGHSALVEIIAPQGPDFNRNRKYRVNP
jgi:hypothetical protein